MTACTAKKQPIPATQILKLHAIDNTITQLNDSLIYSCWDTTLKIYDLKVGKVTYSRKLQDLCYAKAVFKKDNIYFPSSNENFVCLSARTGDTIWSLKLNGRCSNFDFVEDSIIVASIKGAGIIGVNTRTGAILYSLNYSFQETHSPDLSPWPLTYDEDNIYISNWQNSALSVYEKITGKLKWQLPNNKEGLFGPGIIYGTKLFIGSNRYYKGGKILVLDTQTGRTDFEQEFKYEEREIPIIDKHIIYFYSYDSKLCSFDFRNNKIDTLADLDEKTELSGNQMFMIADTIVYSDASFHLSAYALKSNKIAQMQKLQYSALLIFKYTNKWYIVN
ncbi:outer membrane protein assembly factor BamB family protein [Chitinophaga silvatica]|uniref:outer membrane protein assembly factor BamB family protein n=1 Tax=Chitinophaga silvatica TaxID=2282649 RepID=UPI001314057A|nr:PQQ-binding-like beta-propeller repeat protein [Chitinophaga silvatica]